MTKQAKTQADKSVFAGYSVEMLIAFAAAQPAKLGEVQAYARAHVEKLRAKGCANSAKLRAWNSIVDGAMSGWTREEPAKPVVKAKAAKAAKPVASDDKAKVIALLEALIAKM